MSDSRFFITLFLHFLLSITTEAQNDPTYIYHFCDNTTTTCSSGSNYTSFQTNLKHLFVALSSTGNATATATNGFYSTTFGEQPNKVSSQLLCRGDVSTITCQNCFNFAVEDIRRRCPIETEAVVWYDECLLRYSCKPNFSTLSESPSVYVFNNQNDTDQARFNEVLGTAMNDAANRASSAAKRFATKEANISVFQNLCSMVQCTPDLSSLDCNVCLRGAIGQLPSCCGGKIGGRVLNPSCYVRYEVYPFYNVSADAAPAPPPPIVTPPVSVINPKENRLPNEGSKPKWIPITASLSSVFGLALLGSFAWVIWRRINFLVKRSKSRAN